MQKINKLNLTYQMDVPTSTTPTALLLFCSVVLAMSNVVFFSILKLVLRCAYTHVYQ